MPLGIEKEMLGSLGTGIALIDNLLWRINVDMVRWSMGDD
jgi:hypothetical protein